MIGTGKYNFPGIRKAGATALKAVLALTTWGAWLLKSPFEPVIDLTAEWFSEWLANKGLVIINLGAIYVSGEFDQSKFDSAMDQALDAAKAPGLTEAEKEAIDEKVRDAFRKFAHINSKPSKS